MKKLSNVKTLIFLSKKDTDEIFGVPFTAKQYQCVLATCDMLHT